MTILMVPFTNEEMVYIPLQEGVEEASPAAASEHLCTAQEARPLAWTNTGPSSPTNLPTLSSG